jgi:hypothetical protein
MVPELDALKRLDQALLTLSSLSAWVWPDTVTKRFG